MPLPTNAFTEFLRTSLQGGSDAASYFSAFALNSVANAAVNVFDNAAIREAAYQVNAITPNIVLSPQSIIGLYHAGSIDRRLCDRLLKFHGIDPNLSAGPVTIPGLFSSLTGEQDTSTIQDVWKRWIELSRPTPPIATWLKWLRMKESGAYSVNVSGLDLTVAMLKHGYGQQSTRDLIRGDYNPLGYSHLITLWLLSRLTDDELRVRLTLTGIHPSDVNKVMDSINQLPSVAEATVMRRIGIITDSDFVRILRWNGITNADQQTNRQTLLASPPSEGMIERFGAMHCWDNAPVAMWRLDDEQSTEYRTWMQRLGLHGAAGTGDYGPAQAGSLSWTDMIWRSHWSVMDIGTMMRVRHRVRGNPADARTWSVPGVEPLNIAAINDIYQRSNIPPGARDYYEALMFNPLPMRMLQWMVQTGQRDPAFLAGKIADNGYSPTDATAMANAILVREQMREDAPIIAMRKAAQRRYETAVVGGYKDGSIGAAAASAALSSQGMPDDVVGITLATADLDVQASIISAVVKRARSDWFAGRTDLAGASNRLLSAGMDAARVGQIVGSWQAERGEGRIHVSTDKVLSLLRKGFISKDEAVRRLDNLGWAKPDELLLLAEVQGEIAKDNARLAASMDSRKQKQIKEIESLLKQNESRANRLVSYMKQQTPPSSILKWVRDGVWTEADAKKRLATMQFSEGAIAAMLAESKVETELGHDKSDEEVRADQARLARLFPPAKVATYYADGVWTRQQAESMLGKLGFTPDAIAPLLDDALLHHKGTRGGGNASN